MTTRLTPEGARARNTQMEMQMKDFDLPGTNSPTDPDAEVGPPFKLAGQSFSCRPQVPAGLLLDLASAGGTDGTKTVKAFLGFFRGALLDESYERFEAVIRDPNIVVPMSTLAEISSWLADEYSDRPTGGKSLGSSDSQSYGDGSTAAPSPAVVIYERSPQIVPSPTSSGG